MKRIPLLNKKLIYVLAIIFVILIILVWILNKIYFDSIPVVLIVLTIIVITLFLSFIFIEYCLYFKDYLSINFINKYKEDSTLKLMLSSASSGLITIIFGIYQLTLALINNSLFFFTISIVYFLFSLIYLYLFINIEKNVRLYNSKLIIFFVFFIFVCMDGLLAIFANGEEVINISGLTVYPYALYFFIILGMAIYKIILFFKKKRKINQIEVVDLIKVLYTFFPFVTTMIINFGTRHDRVIVLVTGIILAVALFFIGVILIIVRHKKIKECKE